MLLYRSLHPRTGQGANVISSVPFNVNGFDCSPFKALDQFTLPLPSWDLSAQLGFEPSGLAELSESYYFSDVPPKSGKPALMPLIEYQKWYQFVTYVRALFGDWRFVRQPFAVSGENPVLHRNVTGVLEEGELPSSWYHTRTQTGAYIPHTDETIYTSFRLYDDDYNFPIMEAVGSSGTTKGAIDDILIAWLNAEISNGVYDICESNVFSYIYPMTLSQSAGESTLTFCWAEADKIPTIGWSGGIYFIELTTTLGLVSSPTINVGVLYSINDLITTEVISGLVGLEPDPHYAGAGDAPSRSELDQSYNLSYRPGLPSFDPEFWDFGELYCKIEHPHFMRPPIQRSTFHEYVGVDATTGQYARTSSTSYLTFMDRMEARLPNFIVGTFESSEDALDNSIGGLEGNYIETILELRSVLQPLDIIKGANTFLRSNYRGGLLAFLKLLGNADLAYRFGIAPTISDAIDINKNIGGVIDRIRSGSMTAAQTVHGKTSYSDLDDDVLFNPYTVVCRSKVVLRPNVDSLLPFLLPLKALGILPSMSNLWDLVPYSWLIDDFVNIGKALDLADAQLFRLAYDIASSTHSVTVLYNLDGHGEAEGFYPSGGSSPAYKLYNRFTINEGIPVLGPTTLPLLGVSVSGLDIYTSLVVTRL